MNNAMRVVSLNGGHANGFALTCATPEDAKRMANILIRAGQVAWVNPHMDRLGMVNPDKTVYWYHNPTIL